MSAVEIDALAGVGDFTRDRWGRPLIVPAGGGKPKPYTRASGAAKPIEDTYNLEQWHRRNVAHGLATDPSLVARMLAIGGAPQTWTADDKKAVNAVVEAANIAAKAHAAADTGTAVHALVEKVNRGEDPGALGMFADDIDAYRQAITDTGWVIEPELVEVRMVCDELEMAGTCDLLVWDPEDACYYVADLKTGSSVEYATLSHATQIAAYANSVVYNPATGERRRLAINTDVGYVIHLPAGQGRCEIHEINLVAGLKAARLANEVRKTRTAAKKWTQPFLSADVTTPPSRTDREYNLRDRVQAIVDAGHADKLVWRWPDGVATFKSQDIFDAGDLDRIEQAVVHAEADAEMPFRPLHVEPEARSTATATIDPNVIDEGDDVDDDTYLALQARFEALDSIQAATLKDVAARAREAGFPISVSQRRSRRRIDITRGLLGWALCDFDVDSVRLMLAQITGSQIANQPGVEIGVIAGQLTLEQAAEFARLMEGLVDNSLIATFTDTGIEFHINQAHREDKQ